MERTTDPNRDAPPFVPPVPQPGAAHPAPLPQNQAPGQGHHVGAQPIHPAAPQTGIEDLPRDMVWEIYRHLPEQDQRRGTLVNRHFRNRLWNISPLREGREQRRRVRQMYENNPMFRQRQRQDQLDNEDAED